MAYEHNNGGKEIYAKNILENYVKGWKIFMDTCSILHPEANKFWLNIVPLLQQYQNKIIIPLRSIEELQKHAGNAGKPELAEQAKSVLKILSQLIKAGFVEIRGEQSDNFADNVFQVVFTKFRMTHKLLLITQDKDLAHDITALNDNKSVKANLVHVKRINKYGFLSNFTFNTSYSQDDTLIQHTTQKQEDVLDKDEIFQLCKTVTPLDDSRLAVNHIPAENETVYTFRGPIILRSKVAAGGEGIIYTTNTPYVAKIYKKENMKKLNLCLVKKLNIKGYAIRFQHYIMLKKSLSDI